MRRPFRLLSYFVIALLALLVLSIGLAWSLLRQSLPAAVAENCRLANVDRERLVFLVSSPVWKSKLRLHGDALLSAAAAAGLPVRTLVVKVVAPPPDVAGNVSPKPLSQAVRDSLRSTAQSVEDPGLRAQLLKLASLP